jgi:hypothetical protein
LVTEPIDTFFHTITNEHHGINPLALRLRDRMVKNALNLGHAAHAPHFCHESKQVR